MDLYALIELFFAHRQQLSHKGLESRVRFRAFDDFRCGVHAPIVT